MQLIYWFKRNLIHIITAISLIVSSCIFFLEIIKVELFLGLIGSTATLYFGVLKYQIENDKMFMELFISFNKRYDSELNDIFNKYRFLQKENDENSRQESLSINEEKLIIDYFNLCAEEYLWRKKNRIPKSVWEAWKAGMIENIDMPKIEELFLDETSTASKRKSYYGLAEELGYYKR
ncbi:MAG: hypothetical protein WCJ61_05305 [Paludibacter sp.]